MFDFQEFYLRVAEQLPSGAIIAEVGIADGASAIFLAEALLNQGKDFKFYLIDSLAYGGTDQLGTIINNVLRAQLPPGMIEILPVDSLNASCRFPDLHFDFVLIDASHRYEYTKADGRLWWRKIKRGGTLAGHDYNSAEGAEVKMAVDEVFAMRTVCIEETTKNWNIWWVKKEAA